MTATLERDGKHTLSFQGVRAIYIMLVSLACRLLDSDAGAKAGVPGARMPLVIYVHCAGTRQQPDSEDWVVVEEEKEKKNGKPA
jgi:hypothetical protein